MQPRQKKDDDLYTIKQYLSSGSKTVEVGSHRSYSQSSQPIHNVQMTNVHSKLNEDQIKRQNQTLNSEWKEHFVIKVEDKYYFNGRIKILLETNVLSEKCGGCIIYCLTKAKTQDLFDHLQKYLNQVKIDRIIGHNDIQHCLEKLLKKEIKVLLVDLSLIQNYYTNFIVPTNVNLIIFENMPSQNDYIKYIRKDKNQNIKSKGVVVSFYENDNDLESVKNLSKKYNLKFYEIKYNQKFDNLLQYGQIIDSLDVHDFLCDLKNQSLYNEKSFIEKNIDKIEKCIIYSKERTDRSDIQKLLQKNNFKYMQVGTEDELPNAIKNFQEELYKILTIKIPGNSSKIKIPDDVNLVIHWGIPSVEQYFLRRTQKGINIVFYNEFSSYSSYNYKKTLVENNVSQLTNKFKIKFKPLSIETFKTLDFSEYFNKSSSHKLQSTKYSSQTSLHQPPNVSSQESKHQPNIKTNQILGQFPEESINLKKTETQKKQKDDKETNQWTKHLITTIDKKQLFKEEVKNLLKTHFQKCTGCIVYCSDSKSTNELSTFLMGHLKEMSIDKILYSYDIQSRLEKLKKQEIKVLLADFSAMKNYNQKFVVPINVNLVIFENMPSQNDYIKYTLRENQQNAANNETKGIVLNFLYDENVESNVNKIQELQKKLNIQFDQLTHLENLFSVSQSKITDDAKQESTFAQNQMNFSKANTIEGKENNEKQRKQVYHFVCDLNKQLLSEKYLQYEKSFIINNIEKFHQCIIYTQEQNKRSYLQKLLKQKQLDYVEVATEQQMKTQLKKPKTKVLSLKKSISLQISNQFKTPENVNLVIHWGITSREEYLRRHTTKGVNVVFYNDYYSKDKDSTQRSINKLNTESQITFKKLSVEEIKSLDICDYYSKPTEANVLLFAMSEEKGLQNEKTVFDSTILSQRQVKDNQNERVQEQHQQTKENEKQQQEEEQTLQESAIENLQKKENGKQQQEQKETQQENIITNEQQTKIQTNNKVEGTQLNEKQMMSQYFKNQNANMNPNTNANPYENEKVSEIPSEEQKQQAYGQTCHVQGTHTEQIFVKESENSEQQQENDNETQQKAKSGIEKKSNEKQNGKSVPLNEESSQNQNSKSSFSRSPSDDLMLKKILELLQNKITEMENELKKQREEKVKLEKENLIQFQNLKTSLEAKTMEVQTLKKNLKAKESQSINQLNDKISNLQKQNQTNIVKMKTHFQTLISQISSENSKQFQKEFLQNATNVQMRKEMKQQIEKMKEQLEKQNEEISQLRKNNLLNEKTIENYKTEIQKQKKELKEFQEWKKSHERGLQQINHVVEQKDRQHEQLKQMYHKLKSELETKNKQIEKMNQKNIELQKKINTLDKQIHQMGQRESENIKMIETFEKETKQYLNKPLKELSLTELKKKTSNFAQNQKSKLLNYVFTFYANIIGQMETYQNNVTESQKQNEKLKKEIICLKEQKEEIQTNLKNIFQQIKEHCKSRRQINKIILRKASKQVESYFNQIAQSFGSIISKFDGVSTQLSNQQQTVNSLKDELSKSKMKLKEMQQKLQQLERQVQNLQSQLSKKKQQLQSVCIQLNNERNSFDNEREKLQNTIKYLQGSLTNKERELTNCNTERKALKNKLQKLEQNLKEKENEIKNLQKQYDESKQREKEEKMNNNVLQNKLKQREKSIKHLELVKESLQSTIKQTDKELQSANNHHEEYKNKVQSFCCNLNGLISEMIKCPSLKEKGITLQDHQKQMQEIRRVFSLQRVLVESEIYASLKEEQKEFILNEVRGITNSVPLRSKTVLEMNKDTFFKQWLSRTTDKRNLLVLLKLQNGNIIGGFSEKSVADGPNEKGRGFMMSVTNMKSYHIRNNCFGKVVKNDPYYFIFGNGELVIKAKENDLRYEVLFGGQYLFFSTTNKNISDFLGDKLQEGKIIRMQFHQLLFN